MRRRAKSIEQVIFLLIMTMLFLYGCTATTKAPQIPTGEAVRQRFSARSETDDGAIVAWNGYTEGYEQGAKETFDITITNNTAQIWYGRYCLQLLGRQSHSVIAVLEQRPFTLEPGVGFSDVMDVRFPEDLEEGSYGLSLAVRRPGDPMVDLTPIQVGATEEVRGATTQQDMDASLAACPPVEGADAAVALAKADLAQHLDVYLDEITVQSVEPTEFPDASLGIPEPGKVYAQIITPGYIIELVADGQTYRYHASDDRILLVPTENNVSSGGSIAIESVEVSAAQVTVRGRSSLTEGTCVNVELWADGVQLAWWPVGTCAPVRQGDWQLGVTLGKDRVLQPGVQYIARAYQPGGPDVVATFPFDLDAPPAPPR